MGQTLCCTSNGEDSTEAIAEHRSVSLLRLHISELSQRLDELKPQFLDLIARAGGFQTIHSANDQFLQIRQIGATELFKFQFKLPHDIYAVLDLFSLATVKLQWGDSLFTSATVYADSSLSITRSTQRGLLLVAPRDFIVATKEYRLNNKVLILFTSIESFELPSTPGVVRASIELGGYELQAVSPTETIVKGLVKANLGLSKSLTSVVEEYLRKSMPKLVESIADAVAAIWNHSRDN